MMRMLGIEIRRCFARRLVRWLIVLARGRLRGHRRSSPTARPASDELARPVPAGRAARVARRLVPRRRRVLPADRRGGRRRVDDRRRVAGRHLRHAAHLGAATGAGSPWPSCSACGLVAAAIAVVLQALLLAAFLPAALGPGTTEGIDADVVALGGRRGRCGWRA